MKTREEKVVEWLIRISLSSGMLSAVADRFGLWSEELSAWGNWDNFIVYTQQLNPWVPGSLINIVGGLATFLEVAFALTLLTRFKTPLVARGTGLLLLLFAFGMAMAGTIKSPLDYSVFAASGAAFALAILTRNDGES